MVLNPDTIVEGRWLQELIKPLKSGDKIITTPKILTYNGEVINTCGAINHFSGLSFTRGLGDPSSTQSCREHISGFSGCSFAIRREHYISLGGFDKSFFMYNEDADFSTIRIKCPEFVADLHPPYFGFIGRYVESFSYRSIVPSLLHK